VSGKDRMNGISVYEAFPAVWFTSPFFHYIVPRQWVISSRRFEGHVSSENWEPIT